MVYLQNMKIYLIGYMGSGKSTVGELLSRQMKLDFIDFDRFIEKETGRSIPEIFDSLGEDKFRELEHDHLKKVLNKDNVIISLGGGTPCFYNNMELINNNGLSIYLEMDVDTLVKRLSKARNKRPLIRDLSDDELRYFIEANLEKRQAVYQQAKITVKGKNNTAEEIVSKITHLI